MRPLFYGDEPVAGESVLLIANHLSELDFVIMLSLAARMGALGGIRFICKASLAKPPVLGWGLRLHHTIFIRSRPQGRTDGSSAEALADASARARDVATDMANIRDTVASLTRKRSACTPPLWIGLYPEGTRLTPEQHKRALAFAAEEQRQPFKYLLQPREKGLRTVLDGGRPHVTHALDLTVAYEGLSAECEKNVRPAGIFDAITRDQPVHVLVRRLPLPREGEDVVAWLQAVWSEKERALARWENDGRYEETSLDLPFLVRPLLGAYLASAAVAALAASAAVLGMIEVYHMVAGGGSGMHAS